MKNRTQHIVELADGKRVPFSVKARANEPFYFVVFRGVNGSRLERSTKEKSQKRALEVAPAMIREEFQVRALECPVWDVVAVALNEAMVANNNRQSTIDDYQNTIRILRGFFPGSRGPSDISLQLAKQFKVQYLTGEYSRKIKKEPKVWKGRGRKPKPRPEPKVFIRRPQTIASRLRKLRVIWERWFIKELQFLSDNPWKEVASPKLDKLTPRYLTPDEITGFFDWLENRWQGWRLPVLFFNVKSFIGNRILELCSLKSNQLQEGRVVFAPDEAKGRKERKAILPAEVFAELKSLAGPHFVWENFPTQLQERLDANNKRHTNLLLEFSPVRLKGWLQDEIDDYCTSHPGVRRFSAHAFRKRAMTEAWRLGISPEKAAIAFGCNVKTMMAHYIAMDEVATSDEVLNAIAGTVRPVSIPYRQPPEPSSAGTTEGMSKPVGA